VEEICPQLNIVKKEFIWELNNKDTNKSCKFENPLTDLPWLKDGIDEFEKGEKTEYGYMFKHARIYQCNYRDGTGFLMEMCVMCPDFGVGLANCEGEALCLLWGLAGDPCTEFEIDFESQKLIWEINNK
jgi:hypothetical protein